MVIVHAFLKLAVALTVALGLVAGPVALVGYSFSDEPPPVDLSEEHRSDELPVETPHPTPAWAHSDEPSRPRSQRPPSHGVMLGPRAGHDTELLRPPNA